ncbi:hypothetical protein Cob_v005143 [Colletotrichum orbiculare MAFF 240422]|uniref:Uncharacterized protein n=1 Tax=Colletotrichum orbiculare (strain 104-T / ATCC 96160 / CBS 514.97 / LARS 414 / MAFF 240422) TaxID=1213857 RepID=A0A484FVY0_COLOR|nr:hypothetical protein Cob_v005143 [Colletotrichum orbiculare MAFF 240422]
MNPSSRPPHEHSSTPEFRRLDRTRRVRSFMCRTKGASNVNHHHLPNAPSDSPRSPGLVPYDTTCLPMRPRDEWSNHCDQQTGLRRISYTLFARTNKCCIIYDPCVRFDGF